MWDRVRPCHRVRVRVRVICTQSVHSTCMSWHAGTLLKCSCCHVRWYEVVYYARDHVRQSHMWSWEFVWAVCNCMRLHEIFPLRADVYMQSCLKSCEMMHKITAYDNVSFLNKTLYAHMGPYETICDHMGPYERDHTRPCEMVWDQWHEIRWGHITSYEIMRNDTKSYEVIWGHVRSYEVMWGHMRSSHRSSTYSDLITQDCM